MRKQVRRRVKKKSFQELIAVVLGVSLVWLVILGFIAQEHGKEIAFQEIEIYLCLKELDKRQYQEIKYAQHEYFEHNDLPPPPATPDEERDYLNKQKACFKQGYPSCTYKGHKCNEAYTDTKYCDSIVSECANELYRICEEFVKGRRI